MEILVLGLNHKTAPVDIRQHLAFSTDQTLTALTELKSQFPEAEFVILSTCNRVELYCASPRSGPPYVEDLINFIAQNRKTAPPAFRSHLYIHFDAAAVKHLLKVGSSLDSMVVGESQIIAQVKQSYSLACRAESTAKILNKLFHCAFTTGKKIYSTTSIANRRVSVAGVAVQMAKQLFNEIKSAKILVVGAGQMGELLIEHFLQSKCADITVANRSHRHCCKLAQKHNIKPISFDELGTSLLDSDIVVASTAADSYLFNAEYFQSLMLRRKNRPLLLIDIAVPRNIDPEVSKITGVNLYTIDDLEKVAKQNSTLRKKDLRRAEKIIEQKTQTFMKWFNARDIGPLIGRMKKKVKRLDQRQIQEIFTDNTPKLSPQNLQTDPDLHLANKLLHRVIKSINELAQTQGPEAAEQLLNRIVRQADEFAGSSGFDGEK